MEAETWFSHGTISCNSLTLREGRWFCNTQRISCSCSADFDAHLEDQLGYLRQPS